MTACGIAVAVACHALFDVVVVYLGVEHGFYAGFETEFGVVYFSAGLDEFGHAYAEDVDGFFCFDHFEVWELEVEVFGGLVELREARMRDVD